MNDLLDESIDMFKTSWAEQSPLTIGITVVLLIVVTCIVATTFVSIFSSTDGRTTKLNHTEHSFQDRKVEEVEEKLEQALKTVRRLEEKLVALEQQDTLEPQRSSLDENNGSNTNVSVNNDKESKCREIRIWMDGAFDMMHYGHMNAFRQGRSRGTRLIVGVNSDETITACKGPPVCCEYERIETVRGCKWVDEVVTGVPYIMSDEYLQWVIDQYQIDYVVHGDDPCIVDGKDVYESAVRMGKYLTIPRTEGISTTDIVGRILLMTKSHHQPHSLGEDSDGYSGGSGEEEKEEQQEESTEKVASPPQVAAPTQSLHGIQIARKPRASSYGNLASSSPSLPSPRSKQQQQQQLHQQQQQLQPFVRKTNFLTTSRVIRLFGAGVRTPRPEDRVVYLAGAWDMFHAGHVNLLERARKLGDYVIVGVHNDTVVNQRRGNNLPIMNLHERVLSVLGCKWVDDVLIDAPFVITTEMIMSLKISVVVTGSMQLRRQYSVSSCSSSSSSDTSDNEGDRNDDVGDRIVGREDEREEENEGEECAYNNKIQYVVPRQMGILKVLSSSNSFSHQGVMEFVERIQKQRKRFTEKYKTKAKVETQYYTNKYKL